MNKSVACAALLLSAFLLGGVSAAPAAAQQAEVINGQPAADEPSGVHTGLVEAQLGQGALLRLPFDQPFTLRFTLDGLRFGPDPPGLHYKVSERPPESYSHKEVCKSEKSAEFAGRSPVAGDAGKERVRFLMPALDPNRYLVLCLTTKTRIEAELAPGEQEVLKGDIERALGSVAAELDRKQATELATEVRDALNRAVTAYARRQGLVGRIELSDEWSVERVLEEFLEARQGEAQCDAESIEAQLSDIISALSSGDLETDLESFVQAAEDRESLPIEECRRRYKEAAELGESATFPSPGDKATFENRIERALEKIDAVDPALSAFASRSIEALQERNSLYLASNLEASSAARRYVSADTGIAYVPDIDRSVPYQGVNIYLRPVNPPSVTPLGPVLSRKGLMRRTALTVGVTVTDDLVEEETLDGGTTLRIVDDWTDYGSLLLGVGFRVNPALRIGGGAVLYRELDNLLDAEPSTEVSLYFSLSLDLDVRSLFTGGPAGLLNGGSPSPVPSDE